MTRSEQVLQYVVDRSSDIIALAIDQVMHDSGLDKRNIIYERWRIDSLRLYIFGKEITLAIEWSH